MVYAWWTYVKCAPESKPNNPSFSLRLNYENDPKY